MNRQAVLNAAELALTSPFPIERLRRALFYASVWLVVLALLVAIWTIRINAPYHAGQGVGYALGLTGGVLMLGLLLYPVRKRVRFMHGWGALKHWFQFHMVGGILGPVLILFHSTMRVGSYNAAVALGCMLLVVVSGVVGRFIYRRIHKGLYGSMASLKDMEQEVSRAFEALAPALRGLPQVRPALEQFSALIVCAAPGRLSRALHFVSLGARRWLMVRRLRRLLEPQTLGEGALSSPRRDLIGLLLTIDCALQAVQRRAQFATYERLFSLWHVVHIPFLCMLVITAIVHVVAVHLY